MPKLKKRLLLAVTLVCSFFALAACSETKIADKPENSAVYDQAKVLSKETIKTIDKLNEASVDVLPGLKPRDSRLPHGKRAQFSSPTHG